MIMKAFSTKEDAKEDNMKEEGMIEKKIKEAPIPSLRRLPTYHNYLKELLIKDIEYTSTTVIANDLNLIPIQVRKDLAYTGYAGKPKLGYNVKELLVAIENFLGWNDTKIAFLVGVGNLGRAILGYSGFKDLGLNVIAGFDTDTGKIGKKIDGIKVLGLDKFENLVKRMKVKIGIITAPAQSAQNIADLMVKSGILAIWNFAPVAINAPENIIIQNENLASSLSVLSKRLNMNLKNQ
jgi:redox-sensing transcriptional repressor